MEAGVFETIKKRRSVRRYSEKSLPKDVLERFKDALRFAPSACNLQPWKFIFVFDDKIKAELSHIAQEQRSVELAPLVVVACGYPKKAYKKMGESRSSLDVDVAIALDHLSLEAASEGVGTCWVGAFDEPRAKELLKIPNDVRIVSMMTVGYPKSPDLLKPISQTQRKPKSEIFCINYYK
jgi:nitroreductase